MNGNPTTCSILSGIEYTTDNLSFATCEMSGSVAIIKNFNVI